MHTSENQANSQTFGLDENIINTLEQVLQKLGSLYKGYVFKHLSEHVSVNVCLSLYFSNAHYSCLWMKIVLLPKSAQRVKGN